MTRALLVLLALLVLGATGFGAAQLIEARRLRNDAAVYEKERADLRRKIWELQKLNAELNGRLDRAARPAPAEDPAGPAPTDAASEAVAVATPGGLPVPFQRGEVRRRLEALNSPEVQQLMAVQQRAALDGRYAALFRHLQLDPAVLERFKNLLVEKQASVMDVMTAARSQGLTGRENRDELRQLIDQSQAEVDAMIRAEIGEAAYSQYKSYETTLPFRGTAEQLERRLSYSDSPLTSAQVEQVVQILSQTTGRGGGRREAVTFTLAAGPVPAGMVFGGTQITDETIARAQGVLSPKQVSALQGLQQEQQTARQLQQQLRNQRNPARSGTPPAPPGGG